MRLPHALRSRRTTQAPTRTERSHTGEADEHPAPARRRLIDYPRHGRHGLRRWTPSWKLVSGVALFSAVSLGGLLAVVYAQVEIPGAHDSARRQASVYYWADGSRMVSVGDVNRQDVTLAQVPASVQRAVIAAENADFYSDSGVSFTGIGRAALSIIEGEETQGGSTITQQYVKNTYLTQNQTVSRKVKELVLALKISNRKTKAEILEGYLNTSWFGRDSYGVQAAAYAYYGVPAKDLDAGQAALLATLLKGADSYDPSLSPANHRRAVDRWSWVLDRQVETGVLSAAERATYQDFPEPRKPVKPTSQAGQTGYLVDIANKYLKSRGGITDKDLAGGGYRVHTTFEKDKVDALAKAVETVRKDGLDPEKRPADRHVEVGAASVRPEDGAVVAVYGGADAITHFSNNADTSGVPAGSAFKPFVYAAALEYGSAAEPTGKDTAAPGPRATDAPVAVPAFIGSPLARAMLGTGHAPFVSAGEKVGLRNVRRMAVSAGLREESMAKLEPTFSIGTSTPSAVRLAGAYTTFVNYGSRTEPYSVASVERDGVPVDGFTRPEPQRAMRAEVAAEVSASLLNTGQNALAALAKRELVEREDQGVRAPRPAGAPVWAGGTNAGDYMRSAWFIGSTEKLSTAVAMFRTKPDTPQLLGMQGVGGPDTERGNVFPVRIWDTYLRTVDPGSLERSDGLLPPRDGATSGGAQNTPDTPEGAQGPGTAQGPGAAQEPGTAQELGTTS
ncbi:transglycosylase domain-containing protein [Streptomyces sp. NPDC059255]|uniref:transglycosylase domain-containing protein n=1 Tax=Streptomyces sp. NPDC059255 TaxID=3346793 RepID=UPI00368EAF59